MLPTQLVLVTLMTAARGIPVDEGDADAGAGPPAPPPASRYTLGALGLAHGVHHGLLASNPRPDFFPEDACSREGGLCLHVDECPIGKLAEKTGLCPKQRIKGAECCHGISSLKRQCSQRLGVCRPVEQCARDLRDETATDCPAKEACCVLVAQ